MGTETLRTLRSAEDLHEAGLLAAPQMPAVQAVAERYAVAIPPHVARQIAHHGMDSAIARQYLPNTAELTPASDDLTDPIGDTAHSPVPGVVHRYPDRALLKVHHACAGYCRFCFRREMTGPGGDALSGDALEAALDYLSRATGLREVILTGGDPLVTSTRRLGALMDRLSRIPHLNQIRIHTRLPVMAPERITGDLVSALAGDGTHSRLPVYMAIHANCADELDDTVASALARLSRAGIVLLGQSVLLRGVNNSAPALEALFRRMAALRVVPYYLHHPDKAPGTAKFRLSIAEGQALMDSLRGRLSGFCLPTYVLDIPGGYGKVPIGPTHLELQQAGTHGETVWTVRDPSGGVHTYADCTKGREP